MNKKNNYMITQVSEQLLPDLKELAMFKLDS